MQAGAVATKGVLGDACAEGYRERRGMADGSAHIYISALWVDLGPKGDCMAQPRVFGVVLFY